jgi:hypothetical protein
MATRGEFVETAVGDQREDALKDSCVKPGRGGGAPLPNIALGDVQEVARRRLSRRDYASAAPSTVSPLRSRPAHGSTSRWGARICARRWLIATIGAVCRASPTESDQ